MEIFKVIFLAFFLNNVVLTHFLGVRSVLWKNDQIRMSFITGGIMAIIMIPVNSINFLLQKYILLPYHIEFFQTIFFILIILLIAKIVAVIAKKTIPSFFRNYSYYFHVTSNSVVLGVCLLLFKNDFTLSYISCLIYTIATILGYTLILLMMSAITDHNEVSGNPKAMQGLPISLITIGLLALAFIGFTGVV